METVLQQQNTIPRNITPYITAEEDATVISMQQGFTSARTELQ